MDLHLPKHDFLCSLLLHSKILINKYIFNKLKPQINNMFCESSLRRNVLKCNLINNIHLTDKFFMVVHQVIYLSRFHFNFFMILKLLIYGSSTVVGMKRKKNSCPLSFSSRHVYYSKMERQFQIPTLMASWVWKMVKHDT